MRIDIRGARENNLKNVDISFRDGLTVVTGVSGSGKTSLVFDTLYHEARRRFLEIFNLGSSAMRLAPAKVSSINGLGPTVAVGQNLLNRNPNSSLATASGLHPFFRLLYAKFSERTCSTCGHPLVLYSEDELISRLQVMAEKGELEVRVRMVKDVTGSHETLLALLVNEFGEDSLIVDGEPFKHAVLQHDRPHQVELRIGRITGRTPIHQVRMVIEQAKALGIFALHVISIDQAYPLSFAPVCPSCGNWFQDLSPTHFIISCPFCSGEGCGSCQQTGMHPEAAAAIWQGMRLVDLLSQSVSQALSFFQKADLPDEADRLKSEIIRRLDALEVVGLGYVNLDRPSPSLSRGEAQRVRLAVAATSRLEDMLHILDEPTVGQHPADISRLLPVFRQLGGPVVYVEHDRMAAAFADRVIDLGPGAGASGGEVVFEGRPEELWLADTPTGKWFSGRARQESYSPLQSSDKVISIKRANLRNLKNLDIDIPLGLLTIISGVSGSGKSTLVEDVLVASLNAVKPIGCEAFDHPGVKVQFVDQSPIGINPRSNPATYTNLAPRIRDLYSQVTGLSPSCFTFNRSEGACPACKGMGAIEVQMRYLPSTWIQCEHCEGQRFSDEVLAAQVAFGDQHLSIADFFGLSVSEAYPLIKQENRLSTGHRRSALSILQALRDVGLGYLPLGQPSPSLSGGEAQRVKLARSLGQRSLSGQLIVLDEPTTGLHPRDVSGLLVVLHRLARSGATLVVIEHNTDVLRSADWIIDLGPGAGPEGGELLYSGPPTGLLAVENSLTAQALREEDETDLFQVPKFGKGNSDKTPGLTSPGTKADVIEVRGARAHNLRNIHVKFPKGALSVVTGVSGSGKSSLVIDCLEAEARRRFLESLSMYERQSTREGPEAPIDEITGLGVVVTITSERRTFQRRATVGTATELTHHLAVLLADLGERNCPQCASSMRRQGEVWQCTSCSTTAVIASPRHFNPSVYSAACFRCNGVGTLHHPVPEKLIIHPEKPLCAGAMYSPGFFPQGYLGKPYNGGYYMVQALAEKYHFDPFETPWNDMTPLAQERFLYGDPEPLTVHYENRKGDRRTSEQRYPGFYGWVGEWDIGGTYTEARPCPDCAGCGLRDEYAAVTLSGHNFQSLTTMPLDDLEKVLMSFSAAVDAGLLEKSRHFAGASLVTAIRRTGFLNQVGLGYINQVRPTGSLSAGEVQRVRLAGLLGSEMTSMTILLDEPTRGLHPREVDALLGALKSLSQSGNTVIVIEHDLLLIRSADYLIDMGPGAGNLGGHVVAQGRPEDLAESDTLTMSWLRKEKGSADLFFPAAPGQPERWMVIKGARANNLKGTDVNIPLNRLVGVCGVSGSGKSTLVIDTLGRVLAPKKQTTSVAYEPIIPGEHDSIEGAPDRVIIVDQVKRGIGNPADYLNVSKPLVKLFAQSDQAVSMGLDENSLSRRCSACGGGGLIRTDLGFLPDVFSTCDLCAGTGFLAEAWDIRYKEMNLPELFSMTIAEVIDLFAEEENIARPLMAAQQVGLDYLVLRQPGHSLSGGEVQRLKIAAELCRNSNSETLYILDEPTVGQHAQDIDRLVKVLRSIVEAGHSVLTVEHSPQLLASCDWLVELGPGGGPHGGYVIAAGTPAELSMGKTPIASYLSQIGGLRQ